MPPVVVVLIPYIFGTIGLLVWGRIADHNLWKAMINAKVLLLAVNYFGIVTASLGMLYFIPQIIKSLGNFSNMEVGWLTMIPYICGGIGMVVWGRVSDAMNERRWNLLVACVLSTGGLVLAGYTMGTWWALVGMSLAAIGFYGSKGRSSPCRRCSSAARRSRARASPGSTRSAISAALSAPTTWAT